jgi:hypothetical protein
MKEFTIDQTITGHIGAVVDRGGNPATVQGKWAWATDSDTVTLEPSADGLSCKVVPGDKVDEVVNITAKADADLGAGVVPLVAVFETLVLVGGQATFVEASFDAPEPKTA